MAEDDIPAEEVCKRVNRFVQRMLDKGAEPPQLAHALVVAATEMGFCAANEPILVMPVVLDAITKAILHRVESQGGQRFPDGETVH